MDLHFVLGDFQHTLRNEISQLRKEVQMNVAKPVLKKWRKDMKSRWQDNLHRRENIMKPEILQIIRTGVN